VRLVPLLGIGQGQQNVPLLAGPPLRQLTVSSGLRALIGEVLPPAADLTTAPGSRHRHIMATALVTHSSLIGRRRRRHDYEIAARSSQSPGLQTNADGSLDIYFGPTPQAGRESNWIPTNAQGRFEVLFRFYGPTPALFDRSWKLTDIEQIPP
jgi:hypothetical protein